MRSLKPTQYNSVTFISMGGGTFVAVGFFNAIAALVVNIPLYTAYTPARRYCNCTVVQVVHDSA